MLPTGDRAPIQRAATGAEPDTADIHASAARGIATPASPLPHADHIQRLFGRHDISGIKAHTGAAATASAREAGAQAYASGDHVVLGDKADLHTEAHEVAHVVQQRGGVHLKGGVGEVGDAYEQHADQVADRVVRGESAEGLLDQFAGGHAGSASAGGVQRKPFRPIPEPGMPVWLRTDGQMVEHKVESYFVSAKKVKLVGVPTMVDEATLKYSRPLGQNHMADESEDADWQAQPEPRPRSRYSFAPLVQNKMTVSVTMQKSQAAGHSHTVFEWWDPFSRTSHHHVFEFNPKLNASNQEHALAAKYNGVPGEMRENTNRNYLPNHKDGKPIETWFRSWEVPYKAGIQGKRAAEGFQVLAGSNVVTYQLTGGSMTNAYNCHTMAKRLAEDAGVEVDTGILDGLFQFIPAMFSGYPLDGSEEQMAAAATAKVGPATAKQADEG